MYTVKNNDYKKQLVFFKYEVKGFNGACDVAYKYSNNIIHHVKR